MKTIEQGRISGSQFMWLIVTIVLPTAVLFIPALTIKHAGASAWMTGSIVATVWGLLVVRMASALGERFPYRGFADYIRDILGKYPGTILGLFYMVILTYVNSIIVREFGEFLVSAFMPETPILVFNFFLLALAASAVRNGIEVIARMNHFIVALMFFALVFVFTLVLPQADFSRLLPVFESGVKGIIGGSLTPMGWRAEVFLLLILMPYLNNYREARPAAYKAVLLLGLVLGIDIMMALAVFGKQAAHFVFPIHSLGTYISVGGFLERVEAFILGLWVAGVMAKVAIWYYCAVIITAQTFNLRDYKPVVLPLGIIQGVWSIAIYDNIRQMVEFFAGTWIVFSFFFEVLIPGCLLLTAKVRKKGEKAG